MTIRERDYRNLSMAVQAVFDASDKATGLPTKTEPAWIKRVTDRLAADSDQAYLLLAAIGKLP